MQQVTSTSVRLVRAVGGRTVLRIAERSGPRNQLVGTATVLPGLYWRRGRLLAGLVTDAAVKAKVARVVVKESARGVTRCDRQSFSAM
eukprot:6180702-Pleurochrysis_carterae.AAC.2